MLLKSLVLICLLTRLRTWVFIDYSLFRLGSFDSLRGLVVINGRFFFFSISYRLPILFFNWYSLFNCNWLRILPCVFNFCIYLFVTRRLLLSASRILLDRLTTSIGLVPIIIFIDISIWTLWDNIRIWWRQITTNPSNWFRVLFFSIICKCDRWRINSIWNSSYLFFFWLNSIRQGLLLLIIFPILDFDFLFWKRRIVTHNFWLLL